MSGVFITFEGADGSGKSSVLKRIIPELKSMQEREVIVTREPGGSVIAEKIRNIILDPTHMEMDVRTEALLYAASRRQHVVETIMPALEAGKIVVSDRFVDSSLVYQGVGRNIGIDEVAEINAFATEGLIPDLTLYLDVDAQTGLDRIRLNREVAETDRLDNETINFHQKVNNGYQKLLKRYPDRIDRVDATAPLDSVVADCLTILKDFLAQREENEDEITNKYRK